jgi:hypothetical protein
MAPMRSSEGVPATDGLAVKILSEKPWKQKVGE